MKLSLSFWPPHMNIPAATTRCITHRVGEEVQVYPAAVHHCTTSSELLSLCPAFLRSPHPDLKMRMRPRQSRKPPQTILSHPDHVSESPISIDQSSLTIHRESIDNDTHIETTRCGSSWVSRGIQYFIEHHGRWLWTIKTNTRARHSDYFHVRQTHWLLTLDFDVECMSVDGVVSVVSVGHGRSGCGYLNERVWKRLGWMSVYLHCVRISGVQPGIERGDWGKMSPGRRFITGLGLFDNNG